MYDNILCYYYLTAYVIPLSGYCYCKVFEVLSSAYKKLINNLYCNIVRGVFYHHRMIKILSSNQSINVLYQIDTYNFILVVKVSLITILSTHLKRFQFT